MSVHFVIQCTKPADGDFNAQSRKSMQQKCLCQLSLRLALPLANIYLDAQGYLVYGTYQNSVRSVAGRFGPKPFRTLGRFGPESFRPGRFGLGRFGPILELGRFGQIGGSFRPIFFFRPKFFFRPHFFF